MSSLSRAIICARCGFPAGGQYRSYSLPSPQTLHSCNVLSDCQLQDHRRTVVEIKSELSRINSEIAQVGVVLDQLVFKHHSTSSVLCLPTPKVSSEMSRSSPSDSKIESLSQITLCINCTYPLAEQYKSQSSTSGYALHSSNVTSSEQIHVNQNTTLAIQIPVSSVQNKITQIQAIFDQLVSQRQPLYDSLIHYRALIAPIRRLPAEVISEIFQTLTRDIKNALPQISDSPMLLTRICSRWRDIAISTPQLWNTISFHVISTLKVKPFTLEMWKIWLSRSGTCPLVINVRFATPRTPRFPYQPTVDTPHFPYQPTVDTPHFPYQPIVDMLTAYSHRWQSVQITTSFSLEHFVAIKGSIPILTSLAITSSNTPVSPDPLTMFEVAPGLRSLTLSSWSIVPQNFWLPWAQLEQFCSLEMTVEDYFAVLNCCPNLVRCQLCCRVGTRYSDDGIPSFSGPLLHHKLQQLHIDASNKTLCGYTFDSLTCPALNSLHLESWYIRELLWPQVNLFSFLARSSCILQHLALLGISLENPDLLPCLEELPSLTTLKIRDAEVPYRWPFGVFNRMTYNSRTMSGELLVPKLKVFELNVSFAPGEDVLPAMVESRWHLAEGMEAVQQVAKLESVRLIFRWEADCEQLARMRSWRDEGLDIQITIKGDRWL